MAKDPNSSNNSTVPNQIDDFGLSRVAQIGMQDRVTGGDRGDRRRLSNETGKGINADIEHIENLTSVQRDALFSVYPKAKTKYYKALADQRRLTSRIRVRAESTEKRLTSQVTNELGREYSESSINGRISDVANSPEAQQRAMSMVDMPSNEVVAQRRKLRSRLNTIGEIQQALGSELISRRGYNKSVFGTMHAHTNEAQELTRELGVLQAVEGQQRTLGTDSKSQATSLLQDVARAKQVIEKDPTNEAAKDLIKTFKDLKDSAGEVTEEFQEARKKFKESAAGGGDRTTAEKLIGKLGVVGTGFSAIGASFQQIGVNQRLGQVSNATGFADFENQKYQTYKAAAGGDIASLMQLSQFSAAESFGNELKFAQNAALVAQIGGAATQIGVGGVEVATGANLLSNTLSSGQQAQAVEQGIKNIAEGAATGMIATNDLGTGVSAGQAVLQGRQARLDLSRAVNAVGAEQVQGFKDFDVGMGAAAIGMGSRGEGFLNRTISDSNLSRMASARISPEQMIQMSKMGVDSMGSMFNENMVFSARANEQHGLGTMQENLQRTAALASAGSNNPAASLGAITEAAVAKGLDSSKALNAVVDHTAQMASTSMGRAIGLDTSGAAAALLMAGITKDTPNKEAALERAASVQDYANTVGTNIGTNYAGMVSIARTQQTTGIGGIQAVKAESIDTAALMAINDEKDPAKKVRMLQEAGINLAGNKDVNSTVSKMLENRQMKMMEGGGRGFNFSNREALLKRVNASKSMDELNGEDVTELADIAPAGMGAKDQYGMLKGVKAAIGKETFGPGAPTDNTALGKADKIRTAGFEQLATAAATGATALGGATTAVNTLTAAFDKLIKAMPGTEREATTAAGKAAGGDKGMSVTIVELNSAIKNLSTVLNNALSKANIGPSNSDRQRAKLPGP